MNQINWFISKRIKNHIKVIVNSKRCTVFTQMSPDIFQPSFYLFAINFKLKVSFGIQFFFLTLLLFQVSIILD